MVFVPRLRSLIARQAKRISSCSSSSYSQGAQFQAAQQLARRVMHDNELETWSSYKVDANERISDKQIQEIAKVWAVKEAAFKAISGVSHPRQLNWHDAFLTYMESTRRPILRYTKELEEEWDKYQGSVKPRLHLSITHDGEYVTAFVIAER